MTAPAHEKPATEQPTLELPTPTDEPQSSPIHCPPTGLHSELWIPGTIVAAIVCGEGIRNYVLLTEAARSSFAVVALLLVLAFAGGAMACEHLVGRGDGRERS